MVSLPDHLAAAPVGKEQLPRAVMAQHQRRRLLAAAEAVFSERGFTGTTVEDLVAAAEIGVGSFYGLCEGKEELLLVLFDDALRDAERSISEAIDGASASSWADKVCVGLDQMLLLISKEPSRARLVLIEVQTAGVDAFQRYETVLGTAAQFLASGRGIAVAPPRLPASLEQTTVTGIAWLLHRYLSLGKAASVPDLFEELAQLALEPYLGEDGARESISRHLVARSAQPAG
jgi:AcrR family transcriptional regulator